MTDGGVVWRDKTVDCVHLRNGQQRTSFFWGGWAGRAAVAESCGIRISAGFAAGGFC